MAPAPDRPFSGREGLLALAAVAAGIALPFLASWLLFEVWTGRDFLDALGPQAPVLSSALLLGLSGLLIGGGALATAGSWRRLGLVSCRGIWLGAAPVLLFGVSAVTAWLQGEGAEAAAEVTSGALAPAGEIGLAGFAAMVLAAGLLVPAAEEMAFRGILYPWLRGRYGAALAIVGSALLFGLCHLQPDLALRAAVLGVVLAWVRERSGSLWPAIAAHAVNNSLAVIVHQAGWV
ncbi:MAG: CPBP family intramembrane metalloprotease [Magnetospirillum sp. WYHS-4]